MPIPAKTENCWNITELYLAEVFPKKIFMKKGLSLVMGEQK